jgi:hypothetical protein
MIKLTRDRHPSAIFVGLRGKRRVQKALSLLKGKRDGNLSFNSGFWKQAKPQLKIETHNKCAYCEADTTVVAHGDVEHFRPKDIYWWLAYCYDNYLFSCQICNQVYKSNKFPIRSARLPEPAVDPEMSDEKLQQLAGGLAPDPLHDQEGLPMATFLQQINQELPGLIDPYLFDPAELFAWAADATLREVRLIPRDDTVEATSAVQAATEFLGLNREELCDLRWREYEKVQVFKDVLASGKLPAELAQRVNETISDMMANDAPFAGMIRYYVWHVWGLNLGIY